MRVFHFNLSGTAKKLLTDCNFNEEAFSAAFTAMFNMHIEDTIETTRHHNIAIRMDRRNCYDYGYYNYEDEIVLCGGVMHEEVFSLKELFITILHEMMHWMQYNIYKWPEADIAPPKDYYKSRAEKMCRKFEKQSSAMLRLYKVLIKIQKTSYK